VRAKIIMKPTKILRRLVLKNRLGVREASKEDYTTGGYPEIGCTLYQPQNKLNEVKKPNE